MQHVAPWEGLPAHRGALENPSPLCGVRLGLAPGLRVGCSERSHLCPPVACPLGHWGINPNPKKPAGTFPGGGGGASLLPVLHPGSQGSWCRALPRGRGGWGLSVGSARGAGHGARPLRAGGCSRWRFVLLSPAVCLLLLTHLRVHGAACCSAEPASGGSKYNVPVVCGARRVSQRSGAVCMRSSVRGRGLRPPGSTKAPAPPLALPAPPAPCTAICPAA